MALLSNDQFTLVNPGLTSDQIIVLLRKHYGNREFKNKSTEKKMEIRFKTLMKHIRISQNRGDTKLRIGSHGRYFTWIPSMLIGMDGERTFAATQLRNKLKKDFEEAARTGGASVGR